MPTPIHQTVDPKPIAGFAIPIRLSITDGAAI